MDRRQPRAISDEIDLYMRTYYSLLRSTGEVQVRALEEAHAYSDSSLHAGARKPEPDVAAFAYSAARLPACMPEVRLVVLGQSVEQFVAAGHPVSDWDTVTTRGRRRPLRWDGRETLAAFITSTTDIDDLVPILSAYQIEWNKMHARMHRVEAGGGAGSYERALGLDTADLKTLKSAFGARFSRDLPKVAHCRSDRSVMLLHGTFVEYQRAAQRWWGGIAPTLDELGARRPVYFVSSNTHSLINLLGGYVLAHRARITEYARSENPEGLAAEFTRALEAGDDARLANYSYYLLRQYLHADGDNGRRRLADVQAYDRDSGIANIGSPGAIDVNAQLIELKRLKPERFDRRLHMPGLDGLSRSDAVILNIDYPLGLAAYHHLTRIAQGVGEIRGIYVMGKAATLNGRVGDVMLSSVAHDEHSQNTYLFRNAFSAADVQPYVIDATVLDGQKALTVRGSFLQNREYMSVFYHEGYTVLEMEAGPYLSAIYELVRPRRHPKNEIVHLSNEMPFDFGLLHYASDTPYSRRQSLLSKSLSFFGVDSTYGSAIAIVRRILSLELERIGRPQA